MTLKLLSWAGVAGQVSSRDHLPVSASPELGLQEYSTALSFLLGYGNPPAVCASGAISQAFPFLHCV